MSYGDDVIMSEGFEPDEGDELAAADYDDDETGSDDEFDWDDEETTGR